MAKSDVIEYLATPYTHKSKEVESFRALITDFVFSELSKEGRIVISPISMCHNPAVRFGMPTDWQFWARMDEEILKLCSKLLVLMLPGWEASVGVKAETEIAEAAGMEIIYLDATPYIMKFLSVELENAMTDVNAIKTLAFKMKEKPEFLLNWRNAMASCSIDMGVDKISALRSAEEFLTKFFNADFNKMGGRTQPEVIEVPAEEVADESND